MITQKILSVLFQASVFMLWGWLAIYIFKSSRRTTAAIKGPFRLFRTLLIIATFGALGGCANTDPLAVASGPVFALNAGHWQPTPQDLAAPPVVAKQ
jgi:hypothetical protein